MVFFSDTFSILHVLDQRCSLLRSIIKYITLRSQCCIFLGANVFLYFPLGRKNMTPLNSSQAPYQTCLMPNIDKEIQTQVKDISNYVVQPLGFLLAVASCVCNTLVILTMARIRTLRRPPLIMLCNLAIIDLIYSLFSVYKFIEIFAHDRMCPKENPEEIAYAIFCNTSILGNLAVISRDRCLAVKQPMWYRTHVTKSRAMEMISIPWPITFAIAFVVYLSLKLEGGGYRVVGQIIGTIFTLISFITIIVCYLAICIKKPPVYNINQLRAIVERERRATKTAGYILLVLLLTFLPATLFPMIVYLKGVRNSLPFKPFYLFLFTLSAFVNPLMNFGRNRDMRRALRAVFKRSRQVQQA